MSKNNYKKILTSLIQSFTPLIEEPTKAIVPVVESETVIQLCKEVQMNFKKAPSLLELESPVVVFGDIHGHALDLVRLINEFIMNTEFKEFKFLFLGDLVDRGEFSVESIIMIFLLIATKPDKIFCIRGNHEFDIIAGANGFRDQIMETYPSGAGETIYQFFLSAFGWMPFSATINSNILCLHGGISPLLFNVNQLRKLERPYHEFSNKLINDILWSDPRNVTEFRSSCRGMGWYFGEASLNKFLSNNHLDLLVRGHECVYECQYTHGNKCLTVFSASNYCGESGNKSSALIIQSNKERKIINFEAIKYLKRGEVIFKKERNYNARSLSSASSMSKIIFLPKGKLRRENSSNKKLSLLTQ